MLFAACFYFGFGVTDLAELGTTSIAWELVALRLVVALVALGGYAAVARRPESVSVGNAAASTMLVVALGVFMVLCWYQPGALAWNTMSQALIVMAAYVYIPNRFINSVAIGIGSSVVFGLMLTLQGQLLAADLLTLALLLIMANALGYLTASRIHIAQRRQFRSALLLQQAADRDPLTACYNRGVLQKGMLDAELTRLRRYGSALSVIMCDIDHFKRINDTYGHAVGDQVLVEFASILLSATREGVDRVVRYGGEEFLVILPQTDAAGAHAMAERMRLLLAERTSRTTSGEAVSVTASFGIASVLVQEVGQDVTSESLIAAADAQLYAVKHNGRNGVHGTIVEATCKLPAEIDAQQRR